MPFDIANIKATPTAAPRMNRGRQDLGPNPWLDKAWDMGLWKSYNDDVAFASEFKGNIEQVPAKRGKNKGQPIEKVTGEAGDAVALIREAAAKLGIGVAVRTAKTRNGFVKVTWYGKDRRKTKPKTPVPAAN